MKTNLYILIVMGFLSCSDSVQENKVSSAIVIKDLIPTETAGDSIKGTEERVIDSFPSSAELIIYPFYVAHLIYTVDVQDPVKKIGFIPLSGNYRWSKHPDSLVIEDKHLGRIEYKHDNFHSLENKYRTRFLSSVRTNESDKIFIYEFKRDSVIIYNVKDVAVVAFLSPYGTHESIRQNDYMIGFEIKNNDLIGQANTLVFVGQMNPFTKGQLLPISWKEIDLEKSSSVKLTDRDSTIIGGYQETERYIFEHNGLEYQLQNLTTGPGYGTVARHLVITSSNTQRIVYSRIFYDGEGSGLTRLNDVEEGSGGLSRQWTGRLFKNRPPVVFGFLDLSFGCPRITFLDKSQSEIRIRCDNRH